MPELATSRDVFPVHEDTAREFLKNTVSGQSRGAITRNVANTLSIGDPKLNTFLNNLVKHWDLRETLPTDFRLGFAAAYRILKMQAENASGSDLPKSDPDVSKFFILDLDAKGIDANDFYIEHHDNIEDGDEHFYSALADCASAVSPDLSLVTERQIKAGGLTLHVVMAEQLNFREPDQALARL